MKYIKYILSSFVLLAIVACSTDILPFLQFEVENRSGKSPIELDVDGKCSMERPIRITASDELEWSITGDNWLRFQPQAGSGSADIAVTALVNTSYTTRTGTIKITCDGMTRNFQVSQAPSTQLEITGAARLTFLSKEKSGSVGVKSNTDWTASSDQPSWCTVSPTSAKGNAMLTINMTENTNTIERHAVITLQTANNEKKIDIEVIQGAYGATLIVSPKTLYFTDKGNPRGSSTESSTENLGRLSITSSDDVTITSDSPWCTIDKTSLKKKSSNETVNDDVYVTVQSNKGTDNRTAYITVKTSYYEEVIGVEQDKHTPTLTVTPNEWEIGEGSNSRDFLIKTEDKWEASSDKEWCTVQNANGDGDSQLGVKITANKSLEPREAIITVKLTDYPNHTQTIRIHQDEHKPQLTIAPTEWEIGEGSNSRDFQITTTDKWEAISSNKDWCKIQNETGEGSAPMTVNVTANTDDKTREATITVKLTDYPTFTQTIHIKQDAHNTSITLSATEWKVGEAANEQDFTVTTADEWTATSNKGWCKVVSPTEAFQGSGTLKLRVEANPDDKDNRTATVTIKTSIYNKTATITVTQDKHTSGLILSNTKWENASATGGSISVTVTTPDKWTATSNQNWCTVNPESGTGNAQLNISLSANTTASARNAIVTVETDYHRQTISICQLASELDVSPSEVTLDELGTFQTVTVTSVSPCTATSSETWCKVPSGDFTGSFTISADKNVRTEQRTAVVTVNNGNIQKTVNVTQVGHKFSFSVTPIDETGQSIDEIPQFPVDGGSAKIRITTNDYWTVSFDKNWCTISSTSGSGNREITLTTEANTTKKDRSGIVTIICTNESGTEVYDKVELSISQNGSETILELLDGTSPIDTWKIDGSAQTKQIKVTCKNEGATDDVRWTVTSNNTRWCRVSTPGGTDGGIFEIIVDANTDGKVRTATIRVKAPGANKAIKVEQDYRVTPGGDDNGRPEYVRKKAK